MVNNFNKLDCVRSLIIAELVCLLFSTSLTGVVEILLLLTFLSFKELRYRLLASVKQPMVVMALVWLAVLGVGTLFSLAPGEESLDILASWRKILLIPMAAAVFEDDSWKLRMAWTFLYAAILSLALSYLSWFMEIIIHERPGIIIHNHATQGMVFGVALFTAAVLLRFKIATSRGSRVLLAAASFFLLLNILLITPGRSGYLALLVLTAVLSFFSVKGWPRYVLCLSLPLIIGLALFLSPLAKKGIMQGINEIQQYDQAESVTSMGTRVIMWQNTLKIIQQRPLFGHGTGAFLEAYRKQVKGVSGWQGELAHDPHNQYLRVAAEHGLAGLILFLVFIAAFFRQNVTGWPRIIGVGILLSWCATSLFSAHFNTFTEGRFLMIWCGAFLASGLYPAKKQASSSGTTHCLKVFDKISVYLMTCCGGSGFLSNLKKGALPCGKSLLIKISAREVKSASTPVRYPSMS